MLGALFLASLAVLDGTLFTYKYDRASGMPRRLASGAALGLALLGICAYGCSLLLGLKSISIPATLTGLLVLGAIFASTGDTLGRLRSDAAEFAAQLRAFAVRPNPGALSEPLAFAVLIAVASRVFSQAILWRAGTLETGVANNIGDLPFHISVITRFAWGRNIPPEDPTFAGTRFAYPFLADFISSVFIKAGAGLRASILLEDLILGAALVWLIRAFAIELTGDKLAGLFATGLVLFDGGLGWLVLFTESRPAGSSMARSLLIPAHDYTMMPARGFYWGNSLTDLLVTQRSLLLGLPIAIIIFRQWWKSLAKSESEGAAQTFPAHSRVDAPMAWSGVLAGLLPLLHTHTYLVVAGTAVLFLFFSRRASRFLSFIVPALLIGGPIAFLMSSGSNVDLSNFLVYKFGWESASDGFLRFWLKNTGLFIPLVIAALLWRGSKPAVNPELIAFYLPFTWCFIAPNLFRLAPWDWDNSKVLLYWYLASAPLVAVLIARLWRHGPLGRGLAMAALVSMTLSGALDIGRAAWSGQSYTVLTAEQVRFSALVRDTTPPEALIVHAPAYNEPVFLSGRRSFIGYPGHIWTHGIDPAPRTKELGLIYAGAQAARNLIARYGIEYAVVGPQERSSTRVNEDFFSTFKPVGEVGEYRLYKLGSH